MARGSSKTFPGNDRLRNDGAKIPVTQENIQEYIKCKASFKYFCSNYIKIISLDEGLINFVPRAFQEELAELMESERFVIGKIPRRYGKTIIIVAYFIWKIIFNDNISIGIFANKGDTANNILNMLAVSYESLPMWMQQGVRKWKAGNIILQNRSSILCGTTTGSSGRSGGFNYLLLDEFAFVDKNIQEEFYRAVYPTITSGNTTKLFIISTPQGMDKFCKIWNDSKKGANQFKSVEVHWSSIPGRDEEWKRATIADIGQDAFDQEFGCEFLGSSGDTLVSMAKLKTISHLNPIRKEGNIEIYVEPQPGHTYVLMADTSQGVGGDYHAYSVMDVTTAPYAQVAILRNNKIPYMDYPMEIYKAGTLYNQAYAMVETNDGREVGDLLYSEIEYENQLFTQRKYSKKGQAVSIEYTNGSNPGLQMSVRVKKAACGQLKHMIETDQIIINDFETISELTTFIKDGPSYSAEAGAHDDLVMTLVMFAWLSLQPFFGEITKETFRNRIRAEKDRIAAESNVDVVLKSDMKETNYEVFDDMVWHTLGSEHGSPVDNAWGQSRPPKKHPFF